MIIKIAVIGVIVCILITFLKSFSSEAVILLEVAFAALVIIFLSDKFFDAVERLRDLFNEGETERVIFSALMKGALICLVTKLASDTALDSGNRLASDAIDFSGRVLLLTIAFPFFESVIETATAFLP